MDDYSYYYTEYNLLSEKHEQLKERIRGLFDNNSIGIVGEKNDNGADEYFCPCCYSSKKIKGSASTVSLGHITLINHEENCSLMELYNKFSA